MVPRKEAYPEKPSSKIEKPQKAVLSGKKRKGACEEGSGNAVKKARFDPKSNQTWHGYPAGSNLVSNFGALGLVCTAGSDQPGTSSAAFQPPSPPSPPPPPSSSPATVPPAPPSAASPVVVERNPSTLSVPQKL